MSDSHGTRRGLSEGLLVTLLGGLTAILLLQSAYQTLRLWDDHATLEARHAAQETVLGDVEKVRAQLESLAGQTAVLAEGGNANARKLQDQLRAQGITIRPPTSMPR